MSDIQTWESKNKRIAELEAQLAECSEYLKEDETPAQCIKRNRADTAKALRMLAEAQAGPSLINSTGSGYPICRCNVSSLID